NLISKSLDAWTVLRSSQCKKSKRRSSDATRLEVLQAKNHWTDVGSVITALKDVVLPRLESLSDLSDSQTRITDWSEQIEFFEMLMFALMVTRPCRPCTYYSAYV